MFGRNVLTLSYSINLIINSLATFVKQPGCAISRGQHMIRITCWIHVKPRSGNNRALPERIEEIESVTERLELPIGNLKSPDPNMR